MEPHLKAKSETSSPTLDRETPKIQKVLNQVNLLTDRLSKTEYPSRYLNITQNTLVLDQKLSCLIALIVSGVFVGFHSNLQDQNFLYFRVLGVLVGLPFLFLFSSSLLNSIPKKLCFFFLLRLGASSLGYSLIYQQPLSYQFHVQSQQYDILVGALTMILASLCLHKHVSQIKPIIAVEFSVDSLVSVSLLVFFNNKSLDYSLILYHLLVQSLVCTSVHLLSLQVSLDKETLESGVVKHVEEISQELREIHENLKEEGVQPSTLKAPTSSIADEILTKIKYLKFKLLQEEKEKRFLSTRNSVFGPPAKNKLTKGFSSLALRFEKKDELANQRRGSFKVQERSPEAEYNAEATDESVFAKWQLSAKDCDSLIKMMVDKYTSVYYPEILKEKNNQINTETAEFLKQHFTEIGNELLSIPKEPRTLVRQNSHLMEPKAVVYSPWNDYLESNGCSWNFDMLKFKDLTNGRHIPEYGSFLFKKFNILKTLGTSPATVSNFLRDVSEGYLPNPYHNSIHGADVANSIAYFLMNKEFGGYCSDLDVACLLISAFVHDLGHPGFNNAFLVATKSTEALLYNDQSVLENLHTAYFYRILQNPASNILQSLNEKDYKYFRKLSIGLILDTDLTKHFVILTKFKGISDQANFHEEENKFLSLSIALKCADVGHGAKELTLHKKWSRRIIEEFYLQGDKERLNGIPVSPLCDRAGKVSNSQQGFISFIVLPLFEAFDKRFFNEKMREEVTDQVKKNLEYWKEEIPKEEKGESMFREETHKVLEEIQNELPK